MASHACNKNDTPVLCAVGDHLLRGMLCGKVQSEYINSQQVVVFFVRKVQEGMVAIDPSAGHADVEFIAEVGLELAEAGFQRFGGGDVDSSVILVMDVEGDSWCVLVVGRPHFTLLLDGVEFSLGLDDIEHGDIGSCFCESACEGESAAPSASCNQRCSTLERELSTSESVDTKIIKIKKNKRKTYFRHNVCFVRVV